MSPRNSPQRAKLAAAASPKSPSPLGTAGPADTVERAALPVQSDPLADPPSDPPSDLSGMTVGRSSGRLIRPFKPYIPETAHDVAELTPQAIILGSIFGIIFGASTVYLALRAGLTISASIPIAVLSIAVFKKLGKSTILENNIVQTLGSAGESIASGAVFTVPALIFLSGGEHYFQYAQIMTLAAVGGVLGILFMIPLRRSLIVKEHGKLPYPEGTACAEVLMAGERGGTLAKKVFSGVFTAAFYWVLMGVLRLWRDTPGVRTGPRSVYPNATLDCNITPEYLGVGYIIGPRIAAEMRRLAERVTEAVGDVRVRVGEIKTAGASAVRAADQNRALAEQTAAAARHISQVTHTQSEASDQAAQTVRDVAGVVIASAGATAQTREAAEGLRVQAERLERTTRQFKLRREVDDA